ncbi:MAG: histidine phosphatase family protein [Sandaracinaceae bacterium]|nr:histidine phosphatase family protein [Sandaracinaceae bacterium]
MAVVRPSLTLTAIRHAPTNAQGLCVGQHDVATFMAPIEAAAAMRARLTQIPDVVHSSPVSRCAEPAALLAAAWGCPHRVDLRLHEVHCGAFQGRPWDRIEREQPAAFARYMERWREEAPPGGECPRDLEHRVSRWLDALEPGAHLLVAHAGVVRALRVLVDGQSWDEALGAPVPHLEPLLLAQRP